MLRVTSGATMVIAAGGTRKGSTLNRGDALDFAVRFVVHDGDVEEADVAGLWGAFDGAGLAGDVVG